MNDIQIKGSEDYGKLCCFRDDEGNELYGHLSLFMKAISNNPNERDMYFRKEDGKAYRLAWKVDEEDVLSPDEEVIHEQNKTIERLQEQLKEANEIIANFRTYDFTRDDELAEEYQVKYGIAGEKIYTNRKPPKEFERWRKKITKSFENKLKSGV